MIIVFQKKKCIDVEGIAVGIYATAKKGKIIIFLFGKITMKYYTNECNRTS